MCGICGIVNLDRLEPVDLNGLLAMREAIRHRGLTKLAIISRRVSASAIIAFQLLICARKTASRRSKSVRTVHRLLAIRDIMLGRSRKWVCAQYGINRENLRHWVRWYNEEGRAGLVDAAHLASLKARISVPPEVLRDGVGRWRAADVQRLIKRDYGADTVVLPVSATCCTGWSSPGLAGARNIPNRPPMRSPLLKKPPDQTPGNRRRPPR